jgi:coproporphyrinogen III oxidase-like Fe-S oxidoreductase
VTVLPAGPRKLLVYLHVPFCTSKCHFCDWVQEVPVQDLRLPSTAEPRVRYIDALKRQIAAWGPRLVADRYAPAILYWGGGTASSLTVEEIDALATELHRSFDLRRVDEATIECSPETLTIEKLRRFRDAGFDRISIGLQSLSDVRLRQLGRAHDARTGAASIHLAHDAGFRSINVDLICGLPGETLSEFEASLQAAVALPISHVSLYPYRPTPGTVLRRLAGRPSFGQLDLRQHLGAYELGRQMLEAAGLPEYALAHFGKRPCESDLAYFQLRMDWIGFGSGATSLLNGTVMSTQRGQLRRYLEQPLEFDDIHPAASPRETPRLLYQALTTREGAETRWWSERVGLSIDEVLQQPEAASFVDQMSQLAPIIRDERGVRFPPECIASAFIRLLFLGAPKVARREAEAPYGVY